MPYSLSFFSSSSNIAYTVFSLYLSMVYVCRSFVFCLAANFVVISVNWFKLLCPLEVFSKTEDIMADSDGLIQEIQAYWPNFIITKNSLMKPTSTFVMQFYTRFIEEVNETITNVHKGNAEGQLYLTDTAQSPEMVIYLEMSKIFQKFNNQFMVGDLTQPKAPRTKLFFKICMHYLQFLNSSLNGPNLKKVFSLAESSKAVDTDHEDLVSEASELAMKISQMEQKQLKQLRIKDDQEDKHKKLVNIFNTNQRLNEEKQRQVERFNFEIKIIQGDVAKKLETEQIFESQLVDEHEYKYLEQHFQKLKEEKEQCEETASGYQTNVTEQQKISKMCREVTQKELESLNINSKHFNSLKDILNKKSITEHELKTLQKDLFSLSDLVTEILNHTNLNSNQLQRKIVVHKNNMYKLSLKVSEDEEKLDNFINDMSEKFQEQLQQQKSKKTVVLYNIKKTQMEKEIVKRCFEETYQKVMEAENLVVERMRNFLFYSTNSC